MRLVLAARSAAHHGLSHPGRVRGPLRKPGVMPAQGAPDRASPVVDETLWFTGAGVGALASAGILLRRARRANTVPREDFLLGLTRQLRLTRCRATRLGTAR